MKNARVRLGLATHSPACMRPACRHFPRPSPAPSPPLSCQHLLASLRTMKIQQLDVEIDSEQSTLMVSLVGENGELPKASLTGPSIWLHARHLHDIILLILSFVPEGLVKTYHVECINAENFDANYDNDFHTRVTVETSELNK